MSRRVKEYVEVEDLLFLKRHTSRKTKITVPGPFTMTQLAKNEFYGDDRALCLAYADAVNLEARDLKFDEDRAPHLAAQADHRGHRRVHDDVAW